VPAITKRALGAVKIYAHVPYGMECSAAKFTGILRFFASFIKLVFMPRVSCRIFLASIYHEVPHIGKLHATPFAVHTAHKTSSLKNSKFHFCGISRSQRLLLLNTFRICTQ
jgi:hypothetical protein